MGLWGAREGLRVSLGGAAAGGRARLRVCAELGEGLFLLNGCYSG